MIVGFGFLIKKSPGRNGIRDMTLVTPKRIKFAINVGRRLKNVRSKDCI